MKRTILSILTIFCLTATAQRFEVPTPTTDFKRHFSHSIEGGFVDDLPRQFVAGNMSDYLISLNGAKIINGNTIDGITFLNGRQSFFSYADPKILLTDFVVPPQGGDAQQAYGCGIYYPYGGSSWAYVS